MRTQNGELRRTLPDLDDHPEQLERVELVDGESVEDGRLADGTSPAGRLASWWCIGR